MLQFVLPLIRDAINYIGKTDVSLIYMYIPWLFRRQGAIDTRPSDAHLSTLKITTNQFPTSSMVSKNIGCPFGSRRRSARTRWSLSLTCRHKYVDRICESTSVFRQPKRSRVAFFHISPYSEEFGVEIIDTLTLRKYSNDTTTRMCLFFFSLYDFTLMYESICALVNVTASQLS